MEIATAVSTIGGYRELMFDSKDVAGASYYSALNNVCKYDVEPVLFTECQNAYALTKEQYVLLADLVEDAGTWFDKVAVNHTFIKSPWYPLEGDFEGVDYEKAVLKNKEISVTAEQFGVECDKALSPITDRYKEIPLLVLENIVSSPVDKESVEIALRPEYSDIIQALCETYQTFLKEQKPQKDAPVPSSQAVGKYLDLLGASRIDGGMKKSEFLNFYNNFDIISKVKDSSRLNVLKETIKALSIVQEKREKALDEFYGIFDSNISKENLEIIANSYERLKSYEQGGTSPKALDFKAKKIYTQLKSLGYGKELSFEQVVRGVCLNNYVQSLNIDEEDIKVKTSSHFKIKFTEQQLEILFNFVNRSSLLGVDIVNYIKDFEDCRQTILEAIEECQTEKDYTLAELLKSYVYVNALTKLKEIVERFSICTGVSLDNIDAESLAQKVFVAKEVVGCKVFGFDVEEIISKCMQVYKNGYGLIGLITKIKESIKEFGQTCFVNYYTAKGSRCSLQEIDVIRKEGQDRNLFNAVSEYLKTIKRAGEVFSLERFFKPFEMGLREKGQYTFKEIFELSVNWLAVEYKKRTMGGLRNGLGDKITHELEDWNRGTAQIDKATLSIIEGQCMAKINGDDPDFAFLKSERSSGESLRRFFKQHAKAILKLKKCFILSPSSASVFFSKEEFSDFDIVIIDEASQLEPTAILPILFRAKQVVLVGDEWQMPPIRHFSSRVAKTVVDEEGETRILGPNTSVLGLALENCAFPVEQFVCHYRSKTESLIAFSQDRFYPNMRTFPARVPKAEGLGFKDIFVADGRCEGGVNEQEALTVVEQLREHFERYYDEQSRSLNGHSVGVVAFGKEQKDRIESLVSKDKELSRKIQNAIDNYNDVAEKLIFFKTIETVQGQEAEHLILSITYGKSKTGQIVQSFGELNRGFNEDKLGQCIFNVAVTRAKSSVTVVHSVLAEDIRLESVAFIGQYLSIVKKFSEDGRAQWVGKTAFEATGFIRQVVDYLISNGVSANRIVIDCGVNKGSIKIPIVVLSKDMSQAELGLWCEKPVDTGSDYFDYNVRYVESLIERGWSIQRIYIHDWVDNNQAEKEKLKQVINKYIKNIKEV